MVVGRMWSLLLRCALPALLALAARPAGALSIDVESRMVPELAGTPGMALNRLRITGPFEKGDADRLRALLETLRGRAGRRPDGSLAVAELSSGGGDILEGVKIGYLFREFDVATLVRRGDRCLSACALAFLGGTARHASPEVIVARRLEIGGQVGFHNVFLNYQALKNPETTAAETAARQGFEVALSGASTLVRYAADMGIAPGFVARLLGRPTEHFDYVDSIETFAALGICPTEALMPAIPRERQAINVCNNALGWEKADAGQAAQMSVRDGRVALLTRLQSSIAANEVSDRLAAQLGAALASKDESILAQIYDGLRRAGVRLPQLFGGVDEVTGYGIGRDSVACEVSLSTSEPDRYDLVIVGPHGFNPPPRSAPRACRWLFRFGARDVINPRR